MRLFAGLVLGLCLSACSDSGVGKACDKPADCGEHLICDVHDGKGTCQEPHDHEAGDETAAATTTTAASTTAASDETGAASEATPTTTG